MACILEVRQLNEGGQADHHVPRYDSFHDLYVRHHVPTTTKRSNALTPSRFPVTSVVAVATAAILSPMLPLSSLHSSLGVSEALNLRDSVMEAQEEQGMSKTFSIEATDRYHLSKTTLPSD